MGSSNFLDRNKNNTVQSDVSANQIDNSDTKAQNKKKKQSEESKLHFDRDKDDFEAMPGEDDTDEVKKKSGKPSSSIAGLNKLQIALSSFVIVASAIVLYIPLRNDIKAKSLRNQRV